MENSKIEWTDHTFNPWIGCSKVHAGCTHCYAETLMDKRYGKAKWGPNGTRVRTSSSYWDQPARWNHKAWLDGVRRRVFCASLADVFEDRDELVPWRRLLFHVIDRTPHLDWLLLTKRPENIRKMIQEVEEPSESSWHRANVWLGTSVSDQKTADAAIPHLIECRDLCSVLFLSVEPLLAEVNLRKINTYAAPITHELPLLTAGNIQFEIDWVIVGGESGPGVRPCKLEWIESIVKQCRSGGVPCFVKQLGSRPVSDRGAFLIRDSKGGNIDEWPEDLQVREFPT